VDELEAAAAEKRRDLEERGWRASNEGDLRYKTTARHCGPLKERDYAVPWERLLNASDAEVRAEGGRRRRSEMTPRQVVCGLRRQ
jgi:hypothetical protein